MPRTYKPSKQKKYKKYDELLIEKALNEYNSANKSLIDIAQKYKISKSVLHRHNTFIMKKQGGQTALTPDVEEYLIQYINVCSEWGYPLAIIDFRFLIKGYLDNLGVQIKRFKNNMPGPDYIKSFLKRHNSKINCRLNQNVKLSRASVCPEVLHAYFDELQVSLEGIPPENIVNYDETGLVDDPGRKRVLVKRSTKYPERIMNHTKGLTSIMMAAAANGTLLPPYIVYKAEHVYDTWRINGPKGCRYNNTASGWFNGISFEDWVKTIAFEYFKNKSGTKILIGDNLVSHLSIEIISECKKQNIRFVFLPANSTHLTQPFDVAFFKPMERAWRNILNNWKKTDGRMQPTIPKSIFPTLLSKLMKEIECSVHKNIKAGFKKCGISPINRYKVLDRLSSEENLKTRNENFKEVMDPTTLSIRKEMGYGTVRLKSSNRKKKIDVIPGRSVENIISEEVSESYNITKDVSDDESYAEEIRDSGLNKFNLNIVEGPGLSNDKTRDGKFKKTNENKITQTLCTDQNENTDLRYNKFDTENDQEKEYLTVIFKIQKGKGKGKGKKTNMINKKIKTESMSYMQNVSNVDEINRIKKRTNLTSKLGQYAIDSNNCYMDFNKSFDMDINTLPVVCDDIYTNEEVKSFFKTTNEESIEAQAYKENITIKKKQIDNAPVISNKRIKIISDGVETITTPKVKINKLNTISLADSIVSKNLKFCTNYTKILDDLMDDEYIIIVV